MVSQTLQQGCGGVVVTEPSSPQMTVPTFGNGAHYSGISRTAPCPYHSGSSARRSEADFG